MPGEVTPLNNTAPMLLRVVDQPVRVLLLEGKPYWDTKFLVRTLSADPSIELTSVVQLAEGRLLRAEHPAGRRLRMRRNRRLRPPAIASNGPSRRTPGSSSADAEAGPVPDRDPRPQRRGFLTDAALATLRKWLAEGEGSLVCFRGPPAAQIGQRLGELMPLRWSPAAESRFHVRLTGVGQSLRWLAAGNDGDDLLGELPSLATAARPEAAKALAVVLATGMGGAGRGRNP